MHNLLILILALLSGGAFTCALKPVKEKCRRLSELQLFNAGFGSIAVLTALIYSAVCGQSLYLPAAGIIAAVCFGILFSAEMFLYLKAVAEGPLSLTSLIVGFCLILPLILAFCFLHENITIMKLLGIVMLGICMVIFANPKFSAKEKLTPKWFLMSLTVMLFNGTLRVIQKIYAMHTHGQYNTAFVFWCYIFLTLSSFCIFLRLQKKEGQKVNIPVFFWSALGLFAILMGCVNFCQNLALVYLADKMDGSIVYPVVQGGSPIITTGFSGLFLGEKITPRKLTAIIIGVTAIVLLNM